MLRCNDTANPGACGIISPMSEADELARRYLALWAEYLTALTADPQAAELLQRWIAVTAQFAQGSGERGASPFAAWPPGAAPAGPPHGPQADAAAAAGASGGGGDAVGELARRVDQLERRLAELEPGPKAARPRRRNRPGGG